ncbi:hypothetical protein FRB94_001683 [Tulasnella sp. JGI-2019a]|nr:hypothetical protein FRB94_001683 [Tulasnella sp. JGI-2019a]
MSLSTVVAVSFALLFLAIAVSFLPLIFRRKLTSHLTVLDDLLLLGRTRSESDKIQGTAVICGGSVAGLFAARVCTDHFTSVVVVEPETWLNTTESESLPEPQYRISHDNVRNLINPRARVMQYTQQHVYQAPSLTILRSLFPEVEEEAALLGATPQPADFKFMPSGITLPVPYEEYEEKTMPKAIFLTRGGFETLLRKLVVKHCPQVQFINGTVTEITPSAADRMVVESVTIQGSKCEKSWQQSAAIVVDATGAAQAGFTRWLGAAGYGAEVPPDPSKSLIDESGLASLRKSYETRRWYITSTYKICPDLQDRLSLPGGFGEPRILYTYTPDVSREDPRTFMFTRIEGDGVLLACGGWSLADRPKTVDQLQKHLASMNPRVPIPDWVHRAVDLLRECEEEATHAEIRIPTCSYIHYHKAKDLPSNFIAVGDAMLRLSPAMGQGCTKAAMDATTLNAHLSRVVVAPQNFKDEKMHSALPSTFSTDFFLTQFRRLDYLWNSTKAQDYGVPGTVPCKGEHAGVGSWRRKYGKYLFQLALKDMRVASKMYHVQHFLAPPTDLFLPSVTYQVLWHVLKTSVGL